MQGAEDEAKGSVLTYVTEAEFRKQRNRSPSCNSLSIGIGPPQSGDRCATTRPYPLDPLWVAEQPPSPAIPPECRPTRPIRPIRLTRPTCPVNPSKI